MSILVQSWHYLKSLTKGIKNVVFSFDKKMIWGGVYNTSDSYGDVDDDEKIANPEKVFMK